MLNFRKIILVLIFAGKASLFIAQDKIYKKSGGIIVCKITDVLDDKMFYTLPDNNAGTTEIYKSEIDMVRYANGKMEDYSSIVSKKEIVKKKDEEFDRNSKEFVDFANGLAHQMAQQILIKMAGKVENSSVAVYFDSVFKDPTNGTINIPIKISYEKYNALNNGFIKGTIKVEKDGNRLWVFENAGPD